MSQSPLDEGQGWRLTSKEGSTSKEMKSRERRFPKRQKKFSRSSVLGGRKKRGGRLRGGKPGGQNADDLKCSADELGTCSLGFRGDEEAGVNQEL